MVGETADLERVGAWARHEYALEAFHRVLDVMAGAGIDVLPVKGIVLAHTLYEAAEDRPMADIDLRVRPRDLRRVARAARAQGWEVRRTSRQLGTLEFFASRTLVEFETTIGAPGVCAITVDRMLARSGWQAGPLGPRHRVPELHDHALLLCVNAFKDKLVNGHPLVREDLLRIARVPGFSPRSMAARAAEARLRTLVAIVAGWLADDRDGLMWREVIAALGAPPRPAYVGLYRALVRTAPRSAALALVARASSDSPVRQISAVGLGLAGTLLVAVSQAWERGTGRA